MKRPRTGTDFIDLIHRGHGGYVSFRRACGDDNEELAALRATAAFSLPQALAEALTLDGAFSINGFWRRGLRASPTLPGCQIVTRAENNLEYLTACFVDCDSHKVGLTDNESADRLTRLSESRVLPPTSLILRSGRGVWPFWLLHDERYPRRPELAHSMPIARYRAVQQALAGILAGLGADASDASRTVRIPGSVNSTISKSVVFSAQLDGTGPVPSYSLRGLCRFLGVDLNAKRRLVKRGTEKRGTDIERSGRARRAWDARNRLRYDQLCLLERLRGGFARSCRNRALLLTVHFAHRIGVSGTSLERLVAEVASRCRPPLKRSPQWDALAYGLKMRSGSRTIRNAKIADWLDIQPAEHAALGQAFGKRAWPPAGRFRWQPEVATSRADRRIARHRLMRELVARLGYVPTSRGMARLLEEYGHWASHVTVATDYKALGMKSV